VWRYEPSSATLVVPAVADDREARVVIGSASVEAARQLELLAAGVRARGADEEAAILEAQALMAADPALVDEAVRRAAIGGDVLGAIRDAAEGFAATLAALDDPLLAARAADVRDVGDRIARIVGGVAIDPPARPSVAIALDLPPSVTAELPSGSLVGIALEGGTAVAHAAILARGLGIPAVVGAAGLLDAIAAAPPEVELVVDGDRGEVVVGPTAEERQALEVRADSVRVRRAAAAGFRDHPGSTADGRRVPLLANIGSPRDALRAIEAGAEGVGLFRTEFLFMERSRPPAEDEQVTAYREVFEAFGPNRPVVVRLADIGGDKSIPYLGLPAEANPFLGVRAIRLAYRSRELLVTQLRAISRAGAAAGVVPHVMAPMIATPADVRLYLSIRDEAQAGLAADGLPRTDRLVCGIMIEVPSAAVLAAELARRVEFFSIGTNDLTQYLFAADRTNAALAHLQDALEPAVLRSIAGTVAGARETGIPVAVCGEVAGDPLGALVLVGLGVDELSADPNSLDGVRAALAGATSAELGKLGAEALEAPDAAAVRALAGRLLERRAET
jgi:phosphoenolpyruvate-protein phosphotransferase